MSLYVLVKRNAITYHDSHFAGGKHAFNCMAKTLACTPGAEVHVVCASSKPQIMGLAMSGHQPGCNLESLQPGSVQTPGGARYEVVRWRETITSSVISALEASTGTGPTPSHTAAADTPVHYAPSHSSSSLCTGTTTASGHIVYHVLCLEGVRSGSGALNEAFVAAVQRICDKAPQRPPQPPQASSSQPCDQQPLQQPPATRQPWLIIDADDSQLPSSAAYQPQASCFTSASQVQQPGDAAAAAATAALAAVPAQASTSAHISEAQQTTTSSLFDALVTKWGRRCIALVQNVHFLPFGPSGTSPRTETLMKAWCSLGAVLCVSRFVESYLRQWWHNTAAALPCSSATHGRSCSDAGACGAEAQPHSCRQPPLLYVPLCTWGCFGAGPFPDLSEAGAAQLRTVAPDKTDKKAQGCAEGTAGRSALQSNADGLQLTFPSQKPVLCVLKLTPEKGCSIILELARQLKGRYNFLLVSGDPHVSSLFQDLSHVKVVPPQPGVGGLLSYAALVLAPSLWLEAWGMVVTEAAAHGVPCIVSDLGGLPEAGMGLCPAVPVYPVQIPPRHGGTTPCWAARVYPRQDVGTWADAVEAALSVAPHVYMQRAAQLRTAALKFIHSGPRHMQQLLAWLDAHESSGCSRF